MILAYQSETGDATNINTLNYRFVAIPAVLLSDDANEIQQNQVSMIA